MIFLHLNIYDRRNITFILIGILILYHMIISFTYINTINHETNVYIVNDKYYKVNFIIFISSPLLFLAFIYNIFLTYNNFDNRTVIYNLVRKTRNVNIPHHLKIICIEYLLDKDDTCPVCLDEIQSETEIYLTDCGHIFHNSCINESLDYSDKCPTCRNELLDYVVEE